MKSNISSVHSVNRVAVDANRPFEDFRRRYEDLVPLIDRERLTALTQRGASWDEFVEDANATAPYGFFIFWKMDAMPIMTLAGHSGNCIEYLMGNHTIAERMFRHDPGVMLYAPLRTEIYSDSDGRTIFSIDQPSTIFNSFANQSIADVGVELDRKVVALLEALDLKMEWA